MRITLGKAKEAVKHRSPADRLEYRINRVEERAITSGKWNGSLHTVALTARYGQITLPRHYRTIEGVKVDGVVRDIVNHWYLYLPGKSDTYGFSMEHVRDLDDGHAVMYSLPFGGRGYSSGATAIVDGDGTGATVLIETANGSVSGIDTDLPGTGYTFANIIFGGDGSGANAVATVSNGQLDTVNLTVGGTLRLSYPGSESLVLSIYGTDENYLPIQIQMTGNTTVDNPFTHIDRIHREQGDVSMTLTHVATDNSETPLAMISPKEEEVFLHRYMVDTLAMKQEATVLALAKLRHIEMTNDQDVLAFTNISALELGMDALQYEAENDITLANQYWASMIKVLNDELGDSHAVDENPVIRFIYPGNTTPRLTSHY